ncbi:MAG: NAD(P)/FAD-dependent oxidoreductase [Spirochaeta sp.]|nr:NAD(P)/FAD-dependent oxidoreductase [Spirochaeta sp.]
MQERTYDVAVIGGGAAGMAAAVEVRRQGLSCAIVERENQLGGILMQCIHNGFGVQEFKQELSGPEFAEEFMDLVADANTDVFLSTTVDSIEESEHGKELFCSPGTRPAGVFTAGLAQRLVNVEGYIPGKNVVIVGSGDIGLIMARRMTWVGAKVHGVVEIQPYPAGLTRNIVQCLNDFKIPLYLSHVVSRIDGQNRVEKVTVSPLVNGIPDEEQSFEIPCDTLLLSVGLVPENELSENAGVDISPITSGAVVDSTMMTSIPGIFSCGNVLHVHDLADYAAEEARRTGAYAVAWIQNKKPNRQVRIKAGANVRYVSPGMINPESPDKMYLRTLIVKNNAQLVMKVNNTIVKEKKLSHVQPSEMVSVKLTPKDVENWTLEPDSILEVSVQ